MCLFKGGILRRFAGAQLVECCFRGRQLGGLPLSNLFGNGRVLARQRGGQRVHVEHGVRRVYGGCTAGVGDIRNNVDDEDFIFYILILCNDNTYYSTVR